MTTQTWWQRHHRLRLLILVTLSATACVSPRPRLDTGRPVEPTVQVRLSEGGDIVTLQLEQYVIGSVLAEADFRGLDAPAAEHVAAVQSVLARTYALANLDRHAREGYQLCATTHCQVYRSAARFPDTLTAQVVDSVRRTTGLVMSHGGHPINAVFHADCGGGTSDASIPWGGSAPPYLRGIVDSYCVRDSPPPWRFEATRSDLLAALNADRRTAIGPELEQVEVTERDPAGRAVRVRLLGPKGREVIVRGEVFRAALNDQFGFRSFRSTRFSILDDGQKFIAEGRGFGHGVGLCQRGAGARAQQGHTPEQILISYYPGAVLTRYY